MKGRDVSFTAIPRVPPHHSASFCLLPISFRQSALLSNRRTPPGCTLKDRFDGEAPVGAGSGPE